MLFCLQAVIFLQFFANLSIFLTACYNNALLFFQVYFMTTLTWYGKEEAVKKAKQTPYCLLRELPDFSHNIARQPTADSRQPTADSRQPTADSRQLSFC
ncbi:DNA methylase N-4/N-6 [Mannheimia varigena USDA-ARS-USMARC-1296]|uniref:DNA methylase N-4/N-6 n=2 Tax=Pasteurellaceae TaxID=712 RepID=W0QEE4_9PAST|nr:DNA methylase N-4/N-6 [Mannheimia varigena USDA-ARS-USMARC-1296]